MSLEDVQQFTVFMEVLIGQNPFRGDIALKVTLLDSLMQFLLSNVLGLLFHILACEIVMSQPECKSEAFTCFLYVKVYSSCR